MSREPGTLSTDDDRRAATGGVAASASGETSHAGSADRGPPATDERRVAVLAPDAADTLTALLLLSIGATVPMRLPVGLPMTLLAFALSWRAVVRGDPRRRIGESRFPWAWVYTALAAMAAMPLLLPVPGPSTQAYLRDTRLFPLIAVGLVGVHAASGARLRAGALWAIVVPALALQMVTPAAVPHPQIDVWSWTQHCAKLLLHGIHPYTSAPPDIYKGGFNFGYTPTVYQYLPADVLFSIPGVLLHGDYRFGLAACNVVTILFLRAAGRRLRVEPRLVDVLTLAIVLHPRAAFLVGYGWTEPFLSACLSAFVYFEVRDPGGPAQAVAFLLLPSLKQYVFAPTLLWLCTRPRRSALLVGTAAAAMTVVPFLVWDFRATLAGILWVVKQPPFRDDSLSLSAAVAALTGWRWGKWPGITSQVVVAAIAFWLLRGRGLGGLLIASALALFASFLTAPQAFMNYYYFVGLLLAFATLSLSRRS